MTMKSERNVTIERVKSDKVCTSTDSPPDLGSLIIILVIGASGDVAKRKVYPALLELYNNHHFSDTTTRNESNAVVQIYGFARSKLTTTQFQNRIRPHLIDGATRETNKSVDNFLSLCQYFHGRGYDDEVAMRHVLSHCRTSFTRQQHQPLLLIYLAVPPEVFPVITLTIRNSILAATTSFSLQNVRVILEKPFGHDSISCRSLISALQQQQWHESSLFRIDHYLGKVAIRNILHLRQQLAQKAPYMSWSNRSIESVHIVLKETVTIDGRGGFYDTYGVVRDVIQNHLLQILTLLLMEIPMPHDPINVRDGKVQVLQQLSTVKISDCIFGQYEGYVNDPTIHNKGSKTPTYACLRLSMNCKIGKPKWDGVPFYLEAGKALDQNICEIRINFINRKVLVIRIQPLPSVYMEDNSCVSDRVLSIDIANKVLRDDGGSQLGAYATLILDVLHGRSTSFVRDDELLEAWRIFTPVLYEYERNNDIYPMVYAQGSFGPDNRSTFLVPRRKSSL